MFLRLEISCVFAGSPRYLDLGPKPTKDLPKVLGYPSVEGSRGCATYGVARLETSFVICPLSAFPQVEVGERGTYDVYSTVPSHGNDGIDRSKVYADDCRQTQKLACLKGCGGRGCRLTTHFCGIVGVAGCVEVSVILLRRERMFAIELEVCRTKARLGVEFCGGVYVLQWFPPEISFSFHGSTSLDNQRCSSGLATLGNTRLNSPTTLLLLLLRVCLVTPAFTFRGF